MIAKIQQGLAAVCLGILLISCHKQDEGSGKKQDQQKDSPSKASDGSSEIKVEGEAQRQAGIQVATVELRSIAQSLTAAGQITMDEEKTVHVGVYASGRVTELHANIGDLVHRGAVLARLHSHDVHETRAAYISAQQEVQRQQQMVEYQRRMRDRMNRLFALKSASAQEVEKSEADLRNAQTDLKNAQVSVAKEAAHLSDILSLPEDRLGSLDEKTEQVPVISPISGTVIDRKITLGTVVETGSEIFTVSDLATVWMLASVNETEIAGLRVGSAAQITTQAYPDRVFTGRVTRLGTQLDPQTRTLQVRIVLPNNGLKLRPAMFASAQIEEGQTRKAIFVPEEAIQNINGGSMVFLRKNNEMFSAQPVQVARRVNGEAEISTGLHPGDAIAVQGSFVIKSELLKSQIGE